MTIMPPLRGGGVDGALRSQGFQPWAIFMLSLRESRRFVCIGFERLNII